MQTSSIHIFRKTKCFYRWIILKIEGYISLIPHFLPRVNWFNNTETPGTGTKLFWNNPWQTLKWWEDGCNKAPLQKLFRKVTHIPCPRAARAGRLQIWAALLSTSLCNSVQGWNPSRVGLDNWFAHCIFIVVASGNPTYERVKGETAVLVGLTEGQESLGLFDRHWPRRTRCIFLTQAFHL